MESLSIRKIIDKVSSGEIRKAPSEYVQLMNADSVPEILDAAICPEHTFAMDYESFIKARTELLQDYANKLISE